MLEDHARIELSCANFGAPSEVRAAALAGTRSRINCRVEIERRVAVNSLQNSRDRRESRFQRLFTPSRASTDELLRRAHPAVVGGQEQGHAGDVDGLDAGPSGIGAAI